MHAPNWIPLSKPCDMQCVARSAPVKALCRRLRCATRFTEALSRPYIICLIVALGVNACSGDRSVTPRAPEAARAELLAVMTSSAAEAIGPDGKLDLGAPTGTGRAEISAARAGALAVALARNNLPYNHAWYDRMRGRPIPFQRLSVCGEPLRAASPFERLAIDDPDTDPHPVQKSVGPFWLVRLCGPGGEAQINVVVSAYATDLVIRSDGTIDFPAIGGGNFMSEAIPIDQPDDGLPSAEEAVLIAAKLTGRRVAAVPELIAPYFREAGPLSARWRIRLDGSARLRGSNGQTIQLSELYLSQVRTNHRTPSRTWAAETVQPDVVEVTFVPLPRVGEHIDAYLMREKEGTKVVQARRRVGVPFRFAAASMAP